MKLKSGEKRIERSPREREQTLLRNPGDPSEQYPGRNGVPQIVPLGHLNQRIRCASPQFGQYPRISFSGQGLQEERAFIAVCPHAGIEHVDETRWRNLRGYRRIGLSKNPERTNRFVAHVFVRVARSLYQRRQLLRRLARIAGGCCGNAALGRLRAGFKHLEQLVFVGQCILPQLELQRAGLRIVNERVSGGVVFTWSFSAFLYCRVQRLIQAITEGYDLVRQTQCATWCRRGSEALAGRTREANKDDPISMLIATDGLDVCCSVAKCFSYGFPDPALRVVPRISATYLHGDGPPHCLEVHSFVAEEFDISDAITCHCW